MDAIVPGEPSPRELSWLDASIVTDVTPDGKTVLIMESGEGGGPNQSIYVRGTDGAAATLIGEGNALALSADGRWVLASPPHDRGRLILLPTGSGSPRLVELEGLQKPTGGVFTPDGKGLIVEDWPNGQPRRVYSVSLEGGKPRPIARAGLRLTSFGGPVSPDGRFVVLIDENIKSFLVPFGGGEPTPIPGLASGEFPIQWTPDGRFLYTHHGGGVPARISRLELATGRKESFRELSPMDPVGVTSIEKIAMTPDGTCVLYSYRHNLSDLYVLDGLK
jgi:hypothetical protein